MSRSMRAASSWRMRCLDTDMNGRMIGMGKFLRLAASTAIFLAMASAAPVGAAPPAKGAAMNMARIEGKPNLNGIWQVLDGANWNLEAHDSAAAPAAQEWVGAIGAIPAGLGVVEGGTIPYKPRGARPARRQPQGRTEAGSRGGLLPARHSARQLYEPPAADHPGRRRRHPVRLRIYRGQPRGPHAEGGGSADRHLDGHVVRRLGKATR